MVSRGALTQVDQLKQVLFLLGEMQKGEGHLLIAVGVFAEILLPDVGHQILPQGVHMFKFRVNGLGGAV